MVFISNEKNNRMRRILLFVFTAAFFFSCHKEGTPPSQKKFHDDFESYATINDMIGTDENHWTEFNVNETNVSTQPISIDTTIVHSGHQSVRFDCRQLDPDMTEVGKCNLNKGGLCFRQGETIHYSAWYYVQRSDIHYGTFFVLDLGEIVQGSMEIRVMAWEQNLELERNKIGLPNLFQKQPATLFPVNQWTHLELDVKLSQHRKGNVRMRLDGKEILHKDNVQTLPRDRVNLVWGTKGYFDRIQVGITAKNGTEDLVMYVDDVDISSE